MLSPQLEHDKGQWGLPRHGQGAGLLSAFTIYCSPILTDNSKARIGTEPVKHSVFVHYAVAHLIKDKFCVYAHDLFSNMLGLFIYFILSPRRCSISERVSFYLVVFKIINDLFHVILIFLLSLWTFTTLRLLRLFFL